MRVGDVVVDKKDGKLYVYDSVGTMRDKLDNEYDAVFYSRIDMHKVKYYCCDKDYFEQNFEKYTKE